MNLNKKRVLIITDSLGAPRFVDGEKIEYEDTWVYKIFTYMRKYDIEVIFMTLNGLDSTQLLSLIKDKLLLYKADIVLLQYGIVDCAPRVLTDKEIMFFSILKLSRVVKKIISKFHAPLSNFRKLQHTEIEKFKVNVKIIYRLFYEQNIKVVNIPIAPACEKYKEKSPKISKNIEMYNNIIKSNTNLYLEDLYINCNKEKIFLNDLHHLNQDGHNIISDYLKNNFERIFA